MKKYRILHIPTGEFEEACIEENKIHDLFYVITRACIKYKSVMVLIVTIVCGIGMMLSKIRTSMKL